MSNSQTDDTMFKKPPGEVPKPEPGESTFSSGKLGDDQRFEASAKFAADQAGKEPPKDGLNEMAGYPESEKKRQEIRENYQEKRYSLGGKVMRWVHEKLSDAFGEENVRKADGLAEILPGYAGVKDTVQGSTQFQEALHNPHLSVGEKAIAMGKAWGLETWGKTQILLDVVTLGSSSLIEGLLKMTGKKLLFKAGKGLAEIGKSDELHKRAPKVAKTANAMADWNQKTEASHPGVTDWFAEQIDGLKAKFMPAKPEAAPAGA